MSASWDATPTIHVIYTPASQTRWVERPFPPADLSKAVFSSGDANRGLDKKCGVGKVKCVIGASMWFCPHIVVLDEPTNYLDRDSLGALSRAIKEFQGGVLMISHNAEFFGDIAPEVWEVPGDQKVHVSGAEWMEAVKAKELADARAKKKSIPKQDDDKFDALGNKIETAVAAADIDRDYVKKLTKQLKALKERVKKGDASAEDEMYEVEEALDKANAILKKEKEAAKKEKEAAKALAKAAKAADKKKSKK